MRPPIRYAYVVSTSYSGTTLLSILLDSHPAIVSIGEVANSIPKVIERGDYAEYPCSCGVPIRTCSFFTMVQRRCAEQGIELDLHDFGISLGAGIGSSARLLFGWPAHFVWLAHARTALLDQLPPYRRHVNHVFDRTIAIARAALDVSGKDVFVDASKSVARVPYLRRRSDLDFRVLHIVRDLRANVQSQSRRRGLTWTNRAARSWMRTHANAMRLASLVGEDRYFRFRWEDFCLHPEEGLDRICHFLGTEPTDLIARVNAQQHHVIGNQMRLKPVGSIRSDESWREVMTAQQLAICERVAGRLNRQFGYS
jgi:hypothetical protein